jgi:formate dehydrogenase gamma subunit
MAKKTASQPKRTYRRFSLTARVEHLVTLLSFTTLALTGLPQEFPINKISIFIIRSLGGIETARTIHHTAAAMLMLVAIFHLVSVGYKVFVLRERLDMLPNFKDIRDAWQAVMYNLSLSKNRPQMGRYTFEEKAEYWALVWGILIMAATGFMMWNPIATTKLLSGEFIPAAKVAHGAEAILAVLAIIVWHMYHVHLKRFNKSMWTGELTEEEMLHEHPIELADLKAGLTHQPVDPIKLRRRRTVFYPVATIVSLVLLLGVYGFVNGEKTAITTVPPQPVQVTVFAPQTPTPIPPSPTATMTPTLQPGVTETAVNLTWSAFVGPLFQQKCITCHGGAATAGLNLTTYADAMKGSNSGPVIIPGDSAGSKLIQIQSAGDHPGQLTPDELEKVKAWIDAGAPEN